MRKISKDMIIADLVAIDQNIIVILMRAGMHGSLTVEYKKKCSQVLWYLLFLCQIIRFIL